MSSVRSNPVRAPALARGVTVFVGKIPPGVEDTFLKIILEQCGEVVSWTRLQDSKTNQPKSFGYCTFATPPDALRALRLLHDIEIDGAKLLVKVDNATQTELDKFMEGLKASMAMNPAAKQAFENSMAEDENKLTFIRKLVNEKWKKAMTADTDRSRKSSSSFSDRDRDRDRDRERQRDRDRDRERSERDRERKHSRDSREERSDRNDRKRKKASEDDAPHVSVQSSAFPTPTSQSRTPGMKIGVTPKGPPPKMGFKLTAVNSKKRPVALKPLTGFSTHAQSDSDSEDRPTMTLPDSKAQESNALFSDVPWKEVSTNRFVETFVRPYVRDKIIEYVGQDDSEWVDFVTQLILDQNSPDMVKENVKPVYAEDTEDFVNGLFRHIMEQFSNT